MCKIFKKKKKLEVNNEIQDHQLKSSELKDLCRFVKRLKCEYVNSRTLEEFIKVLKSKLEPRYFKFSFNNESSKTIIGDKIFVADVRQNPYVKKGFRPDELKESLGSNDIEYTRYKYLGNPFYKRHLKEKDFRIAKREYLDYVKSNQKASKDFEDLFNNFRFRKIICLICYCETNDPKYCHRFWLKEALINKKRAILGLTQDYKLKIEG